MAESARHDAPNLDPELYDLYLHRMDAGFSDKFLAFTRILDGLLQEPGTPIVVSTGAGSGKLELALARTYPGAHIVALDYSYPMIETIQGAIEKDGRTNGTPVRNMSVLQASAEYMPIQPHSVKGVLAPSFIHELASFADGYRFGPAVARYTQSALLSLQAGGRYVIRDFMAPNEPDKPVIMRIGEVRSQSDADPLEFVRKFVDQFRGWDHPNDQLDLRVQIEELNNRHAFIQGARIQMSFRYAMEIAGHYSWASRFDDEIKERYEYLPAGPYASYVQEQGRVAGVATRVVTAESWHQAGYEENVGGRLDFFHNNGRPLRTPVFTGLIAVERVT